MSIERIKELTKDIYTKGTTDEIIKELVVNVCSYLIEQHEKKKIYTAIEAEQVQNNVMSDVIDKMIDNCKSKVDDPVVEVGQIRRWNKKYEWGRMFEVVAVVSDMVKTQYAGEKGTRTFRISEIVKNTELVTMENIETGEWVKNIVSGNKYKVESIEGSMITHLKQDKLIANNKGFYTPCLPPVEEQPNEDEPTLGDLVEELHKLADKVKKADKVKLITGFTPNDWMIVKGSQVSKDYDQVIDNYKREHKLYTQEEVDELKHESFQKGWEKGWNELMKNIKRSYDIHSES